MSALLRPDGFLFQEVSGLYYSRHRRQDKLNTWHCTIITVSTVRVVFNNPQTEIGVPIREFSWCIVTNREGYLSSSEGKTREKNDVAIDE